MTMYEWLWWLAPAARIAGLLWTQVLWRKGVGLAWWPVAAVLAVALAPRNLPIPRELDPLSVVTVELLLGIVLGLLVTLPGHALLGMTAVASRLQGIGPQAGSSLSLLAVAVVLAGGLGANLHHPLLATIHDTFIWFPVAAPDVWLAPEHGWPTAAAAVHGVTVLALALATPVLLGAVVIDLLGLLVAGGPHPAALLAGVVRGWAQAAAALIALSASWAVYRELWVRTWT